MPIFLAKVENFEKMFLLNHKKNMQEQLKIIDSTFENWKGNCKQLDDVLVIGIKFSDI